jgi:hypothetical protein
MSETHGAPRALTFDDYQYLAAQTMRVPNGAYLNAWKQTYAEFISGEALEALGQHGPSALLMLPEEYAPNSWAEVGPNLKQETMDELSDMLWFGFSAAQLAGLSGGEAVRHALRFHLGDTVPDITSFNQAQLIISEYADEIRISNKLSMYRAETLGPLSMTSLKANPFYWFTRSSTRVLRALGDERQVAGPPIMTDLEQVTALPLAIGDYLLMLGYISSERLGWNFEDMALYNFQKLSERELWGKPTTDYDSSNG